MVRRTILCSLGAAATFAASLTAADRAIDIYGPWQTVLVVRLIGFVALATIVLARRERVRFPARAWPILLAFGVLDTMGHLLLYTGLGLPNGEYAIVASVGYTVGTVVLARIFLREPVSPLQWGGVAMVVGRRRGPRRVWVERYPAPGFTSEDQPSFPGGRALPCQDASPAIDASQMG